MGYRPNIARCPRDPSRNRGSPRRAVHAGFSLVELLLTAAIVMILFTLYWSPSAASRQRSLQASCQKNLQAVYVALQIYSADFGGKFPQVANAQTSEDALDVLVPKYTSDTAPFICPGSSDSSLPSGESFRKRKISYSYYMGRGPASPQLVILSDKQINTRAKQAGQPVFSANGKPPGNNHQKFGGNFLFGDGHVDGGGPKLSFPLDIGAGEVLLNP